MIKELQKELDLKTAELKVKEAELKPLKDSIKELKDKIKELQDNDRFAGFDETMRTYYSYQLPKHFADDMFELYRGNDSKLENLMREFFDDFDLDRYKRYNIEEILWEWDRAGDYLKKWGVSKEVIKGLELAYCFSDQKYMDKNKLNDKVIKKITDIDEDERACVLEFMKIYYNFNCNEFECDW